MREGDDMRKSIGAGLVAMATAALLLAPAAPAAAQQYDCTFMGPSYIVKDAIDCVYYIAQYIG